MAKKQFEPEILERPDNAEPGTFAGGFLPPTGGESELPTAPARTYFADTEVALAYWQSGRTPEECAQMMAAHCDEGGYWIP